jgi:hypothetical protein
MSFCFVALATGPWFKKALFLTMEKCSRIVLAGASKNVIFSAFRHFHPLILTRNSNTRFWVRKRGFVKTPFEEAVSVKTFFEEAFLWKPWLIDLPKHRLFPLLLGYINSRIDSQEEKWHEEKYMRRIVEKPGGGRCLLRQ